MSRQDFIDLADGFLIRADGLLVNQVIFDPYQVRLHLRYGEREEDADRSYQIILEGPFTLGSPDGGVERLDPEGEPRALGPALALLRQTVLKVQVSANSELRVEFSNDAVIESSAQPDYGDEPWNITGGDGLLVVAPPSGGEPAILWGGGDDPTFTVSK